MDAARQFDWSASREDFDRVVEALLERVWSTKTDGVAYAIDGRGGDGGLDVFVSVDGDPDKPVHVYQLKFFPEGMSNGFKSRREQVKRSFLSVADNHALKTWTLVIPGNPTVQELKSVLALKGSRDLRLDVIGQSKLDETIAQHPDLLAWATRNPLVETLRMARMETDALAGGSDLAGRVGALGALVNGRSAYWGTAFSHAGGVTTQSLYAKRPDAHEKEPLNISFTALFKGPDEELQRRFTSFVEYGTAEPLRLPASAVEDLVFEGPEWFAQAGELQALEIHPIPLETPIDASVRGVDEEEVVISILHGSLTLASAGSRGFTLRGTFGGLTLTVQKGDAGAEVTMTYSLVGLTGTEARKLLNLIALINAGGRWQIVRDGDAVLTFDGRGEPQHDGQLFPQTWIDLAEDVAVIERELDLAFRMPSDLSNQERIDLKIVRMLLEGRVTTSPMVGSFTGTMAADLSDEDLEVLTTPHAMVKKAPFVMTLLGQKVRIGILGAYHPHMEVVAGDAHREAHLRGVGEGRKVVIEPQDGTPIRLWLDGSLAPGDRIVPEPWNLPGIDEHPGLGQAGVAALERAKGDHEEPSEQ